MSNAVFPSLPGLKWDVQKIPQWLSKVQRSISGKEIRAAFWTNPIYTWQLSYEILRQSSTFQELQTILGFFNQRQGKFDSFLFSDPNDNNVTAHGFGVGDGVRTAFQLQRAPLGNRQADFSGTFPVATTPRTNLVFWSADFTSASWAKSGGTLPVVTANQAVAPDGTSTADKVVFVAPTGADVSLVSQDGLTTIATANQYVASFWVKAASAADVGKIIVFRGVGRVTYTTVVLTANWQRVQAAETAFNAQSFIGIGLVPSSGSSTGAVTVHLWGAQEEAGALATAYIPTTSAIATATPAYYPAAGDGFEPVFDLDYTQPSQPQIFVSDWEGNQLQYPTPRTNLLIRSQELDNAAWTHPFASVTPNADTAPDGTLTADKITPDTSNNTHYNAQSPATAPFTTYTKSVFAKAAGYNWLGIQTKTADGVFHLALFDLSTGSLGATTLSTSTITRAPNGYYRCTMTYTSGAGAGAANDAFFASNLANFSAFVGDGTSGIYLWGAQTEVGAVASSYIPTTSATVTVTDYTLSTTGLVTFAVAPLAGAAITWSGSYFWRVRFDMDQSEFNNFLSQLWEAKKITLVSVKT